MPLAKLDGEQEEFMENFLKLGREERESIAYLVLQMAMREIPKSNIIEFRRGSDVENS